MRSKRLSERRSGGGMVNDLEESLIDREETRIDTSHLDLWRWMGVPISNDEKFIEIPPNLRDEALSFSLIRITCKVIN